MNAQEIIKTTQSLGISLTVNQDRLVITSPVGKLTTRLKDDLKNHKAELIDLIAHKKAKASRPNVYRVCVDDKWMTVIDPERKPLASFKESIYLRFGKERVNHIQNN